MRSITNLGNLLSSEISTACVILFLLCYIRAINSQLVNFCPKHILIDVPPSNALETLQWEGKQKRKARENQNTQNCLNTEKIGEENNF
mmetsp:Transcript_10876/g.23312  ORF Transcript_10876/g.23312 Transcript_10876/m.23312 type:complete len:88 (-) Transcript_10876:39-302(-)